LLCSQYLTPSLQHPGRSQSTPNQSPPHPTPQTLNSYVRYMSSIRAIQDYLGRKADKAALPRVENTNVDRSVGVIHLAVMG
jgi:2-phosphoglycerate kinase